MVNTDTRPSDSRADTKRGEENMLKHNQEPVVEPLLITMNQAEKTLNLDDNSIRKLIRHGEIEAIKIGRSLRIKYASLEAFIERQSRT
jgi:excisionase family DNA binding protein